MRKWLQALVDRLLPAVGLLQDTPEGQAEAIVWATWMRQQWVEHGLVELKQQRNLMTDVRNAIRRQLGEDHLVLDCLNFTVAEWTTINSPIEEQVARRNENVVLLENPDAIVAQAVRLLESREWADVAAGLVVLTGRRSSEILGTAQFQPMSQWSVLFTGALKRRGESQRLSFEIPTLTTAERIISALAKLRQVGPTEGLTAGQINQKYAQAVATACDRHFSAIVPKREGRDNLFSHLFRSVYAAIATLWYAPPNVDANEYKAAIQGHYAILDADDGTLKRSLAASRHYNDYKIGDLNGNIDGRQGIKLGYGGVEVIDVFNPDRRAESLAMTSDQATTDLTNLHSDLTDSHVDPLDETEDTAMAVTQEVSQQAIESVSEALEALPPVLGGEETEAVIPPKRRVARRVKPVAVDLELLKSVASQFGVEVRGGKGQGYDQALLELLLVLEHNEIGLSDSVSHQSSPSTSQTVADQAKTLAWLTGRVEGLEAQLAQVQQEKQDAISIAQQNQQARQEIEPLRDENEQLKAELQQTQSRLAGIQRFLTGGERQSSDPGKGAEIQTSQRDQDGAESPRAAIAASPSSQKPKDERPAQALPVQADLDPDVLRALQAILDYNDHTATSHADRWTISIPVMKDLLKQLGKATQPKIEAVLKARRGVIEEHHRRHGLGERHNRVHKGRSISEIIKL